MLADQFAAAASGARSTTMLDLVARQLWAAHGEGHLSDPDAEHISEAVQARRAALARGKGAVSPSTPALARPRAPAPSRSHAVHSGAMTRTMLVRLGRPRRAMFGAVPPLLVGPRWRKSRGHFAPAVDDPARLHGPVTAKLCALATSVSPVFPWSGRLAMSGLRLKRFLF